MLFRSGKEELEVSHLPEWSIVRSSRTLLLGKLLADSRVLALEGYFSKAVARCLLNDKLLVRDLLTMDESQLRSKTHDIFGGYDDRLRDAAEGKVESVFDCRVALRGESTVGMELKLCKDLVKDPLTYPFEEGFQVVIKHWRTERPNCYLLVSPQAKRLKPILSLIRRIENSNPEIRLFGVTDTDETILRLLFKRFTRTESGKRARGALEAFVAPDPDRWTRLFAANLEPSQATQPESLVFFSEKELRHEVPEHAPLALKFAASKNALPEAAAAQLVELVTKHPEHFKPYAFEELEKAVHAAYKSTPSSQLAEASILLLELQEAITHESKWVVPNVECYNESGQIERELDVVVVWLDDRVQVRLVEGTSQDREHKSMQDAAKLVEVKSEIEQRYSDVAVKTRVYGPDPEVEFRPRSR